MSTLVVDEVLVRKRSSSVGTAYFYVRHDDKSSHSLTDLLGSITSQLARQNPFALADVMELRDQHPHVDSLSAALDDDELANRFRIVSTHFEHTYIIIDGLDECGSRFDSDRKRLLDAVTGLHQDGDNSTHVLVFSQDEFDIRSKFHAAGFQMISVAATSADLRLYVNAWLPSLDIQSEKIRVEAVEMLVSESKGM